MAPKNIKKRNGKTEDFNLEKILRSLSKAISSSGHKDNPRTKEFAKQVLVYLEADHNKETFTTDDIRSAINIVLLENNLPDVAKNYFKTRGQKIRTEQPTLTPTGVKQIKKRDGAIVAFDKNKVFNAVLKAGEASGELDKEEAEKLTDIIVSILEYKFDDNIIPTVEEIQDVIEIILIQANWARTAKAFIIYRDRRKQIRLEHGKETTSPEVQKLEALNIPLSKQAKHILNNSTSFEELGRIVFIDRYAIKSPQVEIAEGDLVVVVSKEDRKYPKKDLAIVKQKLNNDKVILHMLTGVYADEANNFELETSIFKCDKPVESINDAHRRVARAVASVEKTEDKKQAWFETFYEELHQKHIQPSGRIMTGANVDQHGNYTSNLTLYNCYVIPSPRDSRKSIIRDTLYQMIEIMSRGGGVGMSLSALRPRYSYVKGVHGKSSGSVSWGGIFSYGTGLIEQGGSRRGALMLMQWDWHPDILEFIDAKTKAGQIENANISVMVSDKLMEAVKNDDYWNLEFPDHHNPAYNDIYDEKWEGDLDAWKQAGYPTKIYKTIKARELWQKITKSAHASAEPGIVFMERYNKESNSYYFNKIVCTNPCGEQGLPPWGVCDLGHLYLGSFAEKVGIDETGPVYEMNWPALEKSARALTRFLDNVIDLTPYHFKDNETNQKNERRVGGGTLGLGELLIKLRLRYGSDESLEFIDKLYSTITKAMYKESVEIAKEKGPFPKFEADKFLQSGFMKKMSEDIRQAVREHGIRNVTLTTQAPTGTVGSMLGTSTGIEPYYAFEFFQQSRLGFHAVSIPLARDYKNVQGELPDFFVSSMQLNPLEHIKVQATIQKWTDSSISKTANAPADFSAEETAELYEQAYELGCKGVTIYRDNSRQEQVLSTDASTEHKNLEYNNKKTSVPVEEVKAPPVNIKTAESVLVKETVRVAVDSLSVKETDDNYGSKVGQICPQCKQGIMIKHGGCTECSKNCGFKGACDMK